jgi:hypothetical protein
MTEYSSLIVQRPGLLCISPQTTAVEAARPPERGPLVQSPYPALLPGRPVQPPAPQPSVQLDGELMRSIARQKALSVLRDYGAASTEVDYLKGLVLKPTNHSMVFR